MIAQLKFAYRRIRADLPIVRGQLGWAWKRLKTGYPFIKRNFQLWARWVRTGRADGYIYFGMNNDPCRGAMAGRMDYEPNFRVDVFDWRPAQDDERRKPAQFVPPAKGRPS